MFGKSKNSCKNNEVYDEDIVITYKGNVISADELFKTILDETEYHKDHPVDEDSETEETEITETVENDVIDKRKDIDELGGFLKSKGLEDEDIRFAIELAEKLAYNKSEASNEKDNEVESTDKRKLIDEIGGILKGKVDEELWRTVIGKAEKLAYEGSEDSTKDNGLDKEEQLEEQRDTGLDRLEKDVKHNSVGGKAQKARQSSINGSVGFDSYKTRREAITEATELYF